MKNERLLRARKEKGYTQEEIAKLLGYKQRSSYANWENGHITPPLKVAIRIAEILEKDVEYLFFEGKVQDSHTTSA